MTKWKTWQLIEQHGDKQTNMQHDWETNNEGCLEKLVVGKKRAEGMEVVQMTEPVESMMMASDVIRTERCYRQRKMSVLGKKMHSSIPREQSIVGLDLEPLHS